MASGSQEVDKRELGREEADLTLLGRCCCEMGGFHARIRRPESVFRIMVYERMVIHRLQYSSHHSFIMASSQTSSVRIL